MSTICLLGDQPPAWTAAVADAAAGARWRLYMPAAYSAVAEELSADTVAAVLVAWAGDARDLLGLLRERLLNWPVLVTLDDHVTADAVAAIRAGAHDALPPDLAAEQVVRRMRSALADDRHRVAARVERADVRRKIRSLTRRELEVARLICGGLQSKQIAFALGISLKTVEVHRKHIMSKIGVGAVAALVRRLHVDPAFADSVPQLEIGSDRSTALGTFRHRPRDREPLAPTLRTAVNW